MTRYYIYHQLDPYGCREGSVWGSYAGPTSHEVNIFLLAVDVDLDLASRREYHNLVDELRKLNMALYRLQHA